MILSSRVFVNGQVQCIVFECCIGCFPETVERIAICPAIRGDEFLGRACSEVCIHRCICIWFISRRCAWCAWCAWCGRSGILSVGYPLILCSQRCFAIERLEPVVNTDSRPYIHHDFARCRWNVRGCLVNSLSVYIPSNGIFLPVKTIGVIALGSIKAQIVHVFVVTCAVGVVVELYLCGVLAENFHVNFIPRVVVARPCIGEE